MEEILLKEISFYADRPTKSAMKAIKEIALHPADVVKVVRCRECRFSEEVNPGLYICHNENVKIVGSYVDPNWYCADGK